MIELDDVTSSVSMKMRHGIEVSVPIQMVIIAPRGRMALYGGHTTDEKCEAIRLFVEAHKND